MKKQFFIIVLFSTFYSTLAQVGINTPNPKALLEIKSSSETSPTITDGLIIPKVNVFPTSNPTIAQQGMIIYLKNTAGTDLPGFYYWNFPTLNWIPIGNNDALSWSLTGNSGTNATNNFIGTTDSQPIVFKTNNIARMRITSTNGNVGINSAIPSEKLDVTGNLRISGAFMPNNIAGTDDKVLLSSGPGVAPVWSPFKFGNVNATTEISKYFGFLVITSPWLANTQRQFKVAATYITVDSAVSITFRGSPYTPAIHDNLIIYNTIATAGEILITAFNKGSTINGTVATPSQIPIAVMGMF